MREFQFSRGKKSQWIKFKRGPTKNVISVHGGIILWKKKKKQDKKSGKIIKLIIIFLEITITSTNCQLQMI